MGKPWLLPAFALQKNVKYHNCDLAYIPKVALQQKSTSAKSVLSLLNTVSVYTLTPRINRNISKLSALVKASSVSRNLTRGSSIARFDQRSNLSRNLQQNSHFLLNPSHVYYLPFLLLRLCRLPILLFHQSFSRSFSNNCLSEI